MSIRKGQHITTAQAFTIFDACPNAVLTRSQGGWFDQATRKYASDVLGITASMMTFRSCEALAKMGAIKLQSASSVSGYWVKA